MTEPIGTLATTDVSSYPPRHPIQFFRLSILSYVLADFDVIMDPLPEEKLNHSYPTRTQETSLSGQSILVLKILFCPRSGMRLAIWIAFCID